VIRSFKSKETAALHRGEKTKRYDAAMLNAVRRKLDYLAAAQTLNDLKAPPGNRIEALSHDRRGQHSIRINGQYRICFVWRDGPAEDVEIVDYH